MSMTDPIADMLTQIRNSLRTGREEIDLPASNVKVALAKLLLSEGYISEVKVRNPRSVNSDRRLIIGLKYDARKPVIQGLKRISKPGQRYYVGHKQIPRVLGGLGVAVVSTPHGLLTDTQARKKGAGGEIICHVW